MGCSLANTCEGNRIAGVGVGDGIGVAVGVGVGVGVGVMVGVGVGVRVGVAVGVAGGTVGRGVFVGVGTTVGVGVEVGVTVGSGVYAGKTVAAACSGSLEEHAPAAIKPTRIMIQTESPRILEKSWFVKGSESLSLFLLPLYSLPTATVIPNLSSERRRSDRRTRLHQ